MFTRRGFPGRDGHSPRPTQARLKSETPPNPDSGFPSRTPSPRPRSHLGMRGGGVPGVGLISTPRPPTQLPGEPLPSAPMGLCRVTELCPPLALSPGREGAGCGRGGGRGSGREGRLAGTQRESRCLDGAFPLCGPGARHWAAPRAPVASRHLAGKGPPARTLPGGQADGPSVPQGLSTPLRQAPP